MRRSMNRAEFRALSKKGQLLTVNDTRELMVEAGRTMMKKAVTDYSAVLALCLRDQLKFGHDRAAKFLQKVSEMFQDVQEERLSIDDIKRTLKDEIGIVID